MNTLEKIRDLRAYVEGALGLNGYTAWSEAELRRKFDALEYELLKRPSEDTGEYIPWVGGN